MQMNLSIDLKQKQQLVMTPKLQQGLKVLQLSSLELDQYIKNEIDNNPTIEYEESNDISISLDEKKIKWDEYLENLTNNNYKSINSKNKDFIDYENMISDKSSLIEYLNYQLGLLKLCKKQFEIGKYIIGCIDNNGYLNISVEDIAKDINEKEYLIEYILKKYIQSLEPLGIGSRNLKECLNIQAQEYYKENKVLQKIINEHLEDLGHNRIDKILKSLKISKSELKENIEKIQSLEPKPGRIYSDSENKYIIPDIIVSFKDDKLVIEDSIRIYPRIKINTDYLKILKSNDLKDEKAKEYIKEKLDSAAWLMKNINTRKSTIEKVMKSILKKQEDFFKFGKRHLKPLSLKDIAEDIGVHESTVSRATVEKYVQTPSGIYELKFFFLSGISNSYGDNISSSYIKEAIKDIINSENKLKPFSDNKISTILNEKGINISRRTVAKYRDELKILSASKRKDIF